MFVLKRTEIRNLGDVTFRYLTNTETWDSTLKQTWHYSNLDENNYKGMMN
jgi:hypothetical protein